MRISNFKNSFIVLTILGLLIPVVVLAMVVRATVETKPASSITLSSAQLRGEVTDDGGCADLELWFEYGESASYGRTTSIEKRNTIGNFSAVISGLDACRTYHFRAVAVNNTKKAGYGKDKTFATLCPTFELTTAVKNLTRQDTVYYDSVSAAAQDELLFRIWLKSTSNLKVEDVKVKVNLPNGINYEDDLTVNELSHKEDITIHTLDIGDILANQTKAITFKGRVASLEDLAPGANNLLAIVLVYTPYLTQTDSFVIKAKGREISGVSGVGNVSGAPVAQAAGLPTEVSTGITNNPILDCLLLPLGITLLLVWIFRSKLVGFDRWAEKRKKGIAEYRARKQLNRKIVRVRAQELK